MNHNASHPHGNKPRPPKRVRMLCSWIFALAALGTLNSLWAAPAIQEGTVSEIRGFSIPNTRTAKVRMRKAREHVKALRWNEAIDSLQQLLEDHSSELVPVNDSLGTEAQVFRGAAGWAGEQLCGLPEDARKLYSRRYDERAQAALNLARKAGDRQGVIAVAERWPVTDAALSAWWTLGDLELEHGNLLEARQAWARAVAGRVGNTRYEFYPVFDGENLADWEAALEELGLRSGSLQAGEERRVNLCLRTLGQETSPINADRVGPDAPRGSLRLPGHGEGASGCPGPEASAWPRPFHLPDNGPFELGRNNLFPVRMGDLVFVTDSLQLFAIHAYSGTLRWSSELSRDWLLLGKRRNEFFAGISREDTMIAPAASEHIVVSAHQVPISDIQNEEFHNISITTVIPDRRLYAYDVETGTELWNHHPPPEWDGESGSFVDRMSVAGPPVIAASRVIVPVYRMYGRIELYAACFDLVNGELLWSTQLVSGQRELNMFARSEKEFSAPPVRVEKDRVVVATQLGAVAVLDLFSGRILWETLYDPIVPPRRSHFSAQPINNVWRNAPPVVADGVVLVTPFDSRNLLGFDLETGEELWSLRHDRIERIAGQARSGIDILLGADNSTVFLGSWPVLALRSPGGLHREAPTELSWRYPGGRLDRDEATSARAIVLKDRLLIPTHSERVEIDRFGGGRRHKSQPWKGGRSGNLLVEDGTLYVLSSNTLDGYFEWDMLLQRGRQEYEEQGHDLPASLYLASLLAERSRTELDSGRTVQARQHVAEAEDLLTPFLAASEPSSELEKSMHALLRTKGKLLMDLANSSEASIALRRARAYAPTIDHLRDTLIEEYLLVRYDPRGERDEILRQLLTSCANRTMKVVVSKNDHPSYKWRFEPLLDDSRRNVTLQNVDIPMWIMLERAATAAAEERVADEFEELHGLIEFWPEEPLPTGSLGIEESTGEFSSRRIGELIEQHGRQAYAPYDAQAEKLLKEARQARDRSMLEIVSELYPHSIAGRAANDDLLVWAIEEGDVEAVSRIALSELPERFAPEHATERQSQLLLFVAAALENAGNKQYAAALYRDLARQTPGRRSTAPTHDNMTIAELAAASRAPQPSSAGAPRQALEFDGEITQRTPILGDFRFLGAIPPALDSEPSGAGAAPDVLLYIHDESRRFHQLTLAAFSASSLDSDEPSPLWSLVLPSGSNSAPSWKRAFEFLPGSVVLTASEGLICLDRETGHRNWTREWDLFNVQDVDTIRVGSGLVLASVGTPGDHDTLFAFDGSTGREVWQAPIDRLHFNRAPIIADNRIVLLPRRAQKEGQVLDIFSGREVLRFQLPISVPPTAQGSCWIEDGMLILPWFLAGNSPDRNRLLAIDLWSGETVWDLKLGEALGGDRQLRSILQHGKKTYLVLSANVGADSEGVQGLLAELHVGIGAVRRVGNFNIKHDQRFIGVPQDNLIRLPHPTLYLHTFSGSTEQIRVQAIGLPFGNSLWVNEIDLTREELHNSHLQLPVESSDTVAMIFSRKKGNGFGTATSTLFLLDKGTGHSRGAFKLDPRLGTSNQITLQGLGEHLLLGGDEELDVLR